MVLTGNRVVGISIVLYLFLLGITIFRSLLLTEGKLISPLDDTYIHLAIAKNFAFYGIWGITPHEFTSSSSSLLWTLGLAGIIKIFGMSVGEYATFGLNFIFGIGIISFSWWILQKLQIDFSIKLLLMVCIVLVTPLPPMTIIGMEHILHAFITLIFVYFAIEGIFKNKFNWICIGLAPLLVGIRYESGFLIGIISLIYIFRGRWKEGILIGGLGVSVIVIYAFISISQGWLFAPNSILVKGTNPLDGGLLGLVWYVIKSIFWVLPRSPGLFSLVILLGITYFYRDEKRKDTDWRKSDYYTFIILTGILLHTILADVGWLNRYEAYLIPIGLIAIAVNLSEISWIRKWNVAEAMQGIKKAEKYAVISCIIFALVLSLVRIANIGMLPTYQNQIYIQQYQMGKFLNENYGPESVVAVNDIGWVSYLGESKIIDIWGLANLEMGKDWINDEQSIENIDKKVRNENVEFLMVYDAWLMNDLVDFHPGVPLMVSFSSGSVLNGKQWKIDRKTQKVENWDNKPWIKVAEWRVEHIYQLGDNIVSFYVLEEERGIKLKENLLEFEPKLPKEVEVIYY